MKKLFIAKVVLRTSRYMQDAVEEEQVIRLVWAQSEEQANSIVRADLEVGSPYDQRTSVESLDISEALGTP